MNRELLKNMPNTRSFTKGEVIVTDGDLPGGGDEMFIILLGSAVVYKDFQKPNEDIIGTLNAGSFFGEMSLFLDKPSNATVVAAEDVLLMGLTKGTVWDFFKEQPKATFMLIKTLCSRVNHLEFTLSKERRKSADSVSEPKSEPKNNDFVSDIFPKGHKNYTGVYKPSGPGLVYDKKVTCPMCETEFTSPVVRSSLRNEGTDSDFRPHNKGVDVLYYQTITCPNCWHSALVKNFEKAIAKRADILNARMKEIKPNLPIVFDGEREMNKLFAGLYLALECADICYLRPEMMIARIWLRISWLYHDCKDAQMEMYARGKALKAYINAYDNADVPMEQLQQLQVLIGELSFLTGDMPAAKRFFQMAVLCKPSVYTLKGKAEDRLEDLKRIGR